ncbi:zinc finger BED domain-containing protein RICESLEEPER 3-like [Manihot esculenta]|uniref:zinc finger BED domain-containing protein RICESLEEPER 3-like n=1 Tax=Manihot esculenta TaxID=3983 RepID=UPI000B5D14D4|nr:zinc finger BED domain-containing protein RICESLEEPER 3-like [Manihot esculenta]
MSNQPPITSSQTEVEEATSKTKRKSMKPRSSVWDHFTKFVDNTGTQKGKCNYCDKEFFCDPKKNGTTSLRNHMFACIKNPHSMTTRQSQLSLQPTCSTQEGGGGTRIEGEGFREWVEYTQPRFRIPSRWTVSRDCYDLYLEERKKLKIFFQKTSQRVCITTDTWTSLQRINYMCVTAHFIDDNWTLQKKIINFCPITSHKGDDIGMAIESCLLNWGIKRVFIVTVDNASSNDVAISYLKKKINAWGFSILNCKYLHMRCIAHIINLVVVDGMKDGLTPIKKVRDAVRYATVDPYFKIDLQSSEGNGVPDSLEWEYIGKIVEFLGHFYELTLRISGSRYVTSNIFFDEISSVDCLLQEWKSSNDLELSCMGEKMKLKFDKYWGDPDKMNKIIYIAVVVDPRYKLEFMHFALSTVYGKEKGTELAKKVKLFPILSHMMKDILAVPISTVASESAFSTGGRVLDCFRSSLTPKIVEALICTQDWLRKSQHHKSIEE